MYPLTYYETFMRYEASDEIFVAMPFTKRFQQVFDLVIEPAIKGVKVAGRPLKAKIINRGSSGAPDIHAQIFDAILHSRLVIADMTVQASYTGEGGESRWQANANVAYEVGLASAWRNPEDILIIHQARQDHSYSFDVQNLRHVPYEPTNPRCPFDLAEEIVRALNQSRFLADATYRKLLHSVSPSAVQLIHQESKSGFPGIDFQTDKEAMVNTRVHALTELLSIGAIRNRHVFRQGSGKGALILYQWTELGLRMLVSLSAIDSKRREELAAQIASVPDDTFPPFHLISVDGEPSFSGKQPEGSDSQVLKIPSL